MISKLPVPDTAAESLSRFITITSLPVQWGDQDAFGHVNNVVYFRWLESARIDLLDQFPSSVRMHHSGLGPILASMNCNYRRQLHFPDVIHVGSGVARVGRSSLEVAHAIFSERLNAVAAEATSVLVIFDYQANRAVRIPDDLRSQLEPRVLGSSPDPR